MIVSHDIADLHPVMQEKARAFLAACKSAGLDVRITCTYRDNEAQDALFARGRTLTTENGHKVVKVTNARAGQSMHNYRLAFDVVPFRLGKAVWGTSGPDGALWEHVGEIGESCGLEWAGRWKTFKEYPHFQFTAGHPLSFFEAGGKI